MILSGTTTPLAEVSTNHSNKTVDIKFSAHKAKIFESLIFEKKSLEASKSTLLYCYYQNARLY